eukprot:403374988
MPGANDLDRFILRTCQRTTATAMRNINLNKKKVQLDLLTFKIGIMLDTDNPNNQSCAEKESFTKKVALFSKSEHKSKFCNTNILVNDELEHQDNFSAECEGLSIRNREQLCDSLDRSESKYTVISLLKSNYKPNFNKSNINQFPKKATRNRLQSDNRIQGYQQHSDPNHSFLNSQQSRFPDKSNFYKINQNKSRDHFSNVPQISQNFSLDRLLIKSKTADKNDYDFDRSWINIEDQEEMLSISSKEELNQFQKVESPKMQRFTLPQDSSNIHATMRSSVNLQNLNRQSTQILTKNLSNLALLNRSPLISRKTFLPVKHAKGEDLHDIVNSESSRSGKSMENMKIDERDSNEQINERINFLIRLSDKKKTSYTQIQEFKNKQKQFKINHQSLNIPLQLQPQTQHSNQIPQQQSNTHNDHHQQNRQYRSISQHVQESNQKTDFDTKIEQTLHLRPIFNNEQEQQEASLVVPHLHNENDQFFCSCDEYDLLAIQECSVHSQSLKMQNVKVPNQIVSELECKILKQGWVKKKTTNIFLGFQERFLVLYSNKKLVYYKLKNQLGDYLKHKIKETQYTNQQLLDNFIKCGEFDLNMMKVEILVVNNIRFQLRFQGVNRAFLYQTLTEDDCQEWKKHIENTQCIEFYEQTEDNYSSQCRSFSQAQSSNFRFDPILDPKQGRFWKKARILEQDLRNIADTGDILLFKSTEFASQMQRVFLNSDYNHVAVLLRCSGGQLKFIEASMQFGVDIVDWDRFTLFKCYGGYERIVYRRLKCQRTRDQLIKLQSFLQAAKCKKYKVTATKLLRKKCIDDSDDNIREDKTYFCSELVASIYKNLGLLPQEKSASRYMPGSFQSKKGLKLLGGAVLEDDKLVDFDNLL